MGHPEQREEMSDVTRILNAIEGGDPKAADELLPLVYEELRLLAAQKLSNERPGQTLQATALVHEAYIRLVGAEAQNWDSRGHFFAAAAEAMRTRPCLWSSVMRNTLPIVSASIMWPLVQISTGPRCRNLLAMSRVYRG